MGSAAIGVLIVEDDPMVVEVNKSFVSAVPGFQVVGVARTGHAALMLAERMRPHLVLLDIYLPDVDGVAILQEIRQRELPADVILVTAAQDVTTIQNVFRYGAVDYIIKPFKFGRLKAALENYAALFAGLNSQGHLDQSAVDRLTRRRTVPETVEELPKGLNEITLKQVLLFLLKQADLALSAEEVAGGLGLARVTARRYLEYLEQTGRVTVELQYGTVGRPVKKYRIQP